MRALFVGLLLALSAGASAQDLSYSGFLPIGGNASSNTATATGGSASRTLADHFADHMTVADFGPLACDFDTTAQTGTDNYTTILAALTWWAAANSRSLEIPVGNCAYGTPIRLNISVRKPGRLYGAGFLVPTAAPTSGTGTVTLSMAQPYGTLTGTGTAFLTQLAIGDQIKIGSAADKYTILEVDSNTSAKVFYDEQASVGSTTAFTIGKPGLSFMAQTFVEQPRFEHRMQAAWANTLGAVFQLAGRPTCSDTSKSFDGFILNDVSLYATDGSALEILCGSFEGLIVGGEFFGWEHGISSSTSGDVIRLLASDQNAELSPVDFIAPNIRGGNRGFYSNVGDISFVGGTVQLSRKEGIFIRQLETRSIENIHVERNWKGAGSSVSGNAGVRITTLGKGSNIRNLRGYNDDSTGWQAHVLRIFSNTAGTTNNITNISSIGSQISDLYLEGTVGALNNLSGVASVTTSGTPTFSKIENARHILNRLNLRTNFITMAASITPNLDSGSFIDVATITSGFTINDPTGTAAQNGDILVVNLRNEATGGFTVTFGSAYTTKASVITVANVPTTILFRYGPASVWRELSRSTNIVGTINATTGKLLYSGTAPTISSGFGTSPSVSQNNGTAGFTINVGTGGSASGGTVGMPTATNAWTCHVQNVTAQAANRADQHTVQTGGTASTVSVQNQTISTGAALAWTASDTIRLSCFAY